MKAIIFDMDGTISDTEQVHINAINIVALEYGVPITITSADNPYHGRSFSHIFEDVFRKHGVSADHVEATEKARNWILHHNLAGIKEIPGASSLIKELRSKGHILAVASGSNSRFIANVLKALQIHDCFHSTAGGNEVSNPKPHPDVYLLAAQRINVNPKHCIAIEDSVPGMIAAKSAGMICIGLVSDKNKTYPADHIATSHHEIQNMILPKLLR